MTEPNNNNTDPNPDGEGDNNQGQSPNAQFRGSSLFTQKNNEIAELQRQIADMRAAQEAEKDAAQRKALEDQGKWQEAAALEKSKREQAESSAATTIRRLQLENALAMAGITDEYQLEGAVNKCPADAEISVYVDELKKRRPDLFEKSQTVFPPPQGGRASGGAQESWKEVMEAARNPDPKIYLPAEQKLKKYASEHEGKLPEI